MPAPDPQHQLMAEAFVRRLQQLFPGAKFSEGKVVKSVGLKPDVYLGHKDGRQWAFEMVFKNGQASHLLNNHERYARAGIQDYWIFWKSLDLKSKSKRKTSLDQGMMSEFLDAPKIYKLTQPHCAVLEMQTGPVRYLYAFTDNMLDGSKVSLETDLMKTFAIGLMVYKFEGWSGEVEYSARFEYVPLLELNFTDSGLPVAAADPKSGLFETMAKNLGWDLNNFIPSELYSRFEHEISDPLNLQKMINAFLLAFFQSCSPEEWNEIQQFVTAQEQTKSTPFAHPVADMDIMAAFQKANKMEELTKVMREAQELTANLPIPSAFRRLFNLTIDADRFDQVADLMVWQGESEELRKLRDITGKTSE